MSEEERDNVNDIVSLNLVPSNILRISNSLELENGDKLETKMEMESG